MQVKLSRKCWNNAGGPSCTECNNCDLYSRERTEGEKKKGTHMQGVRLYTCISPSNVIFHLQEKICRDDHEGFWECVCMCVRWLWSYCVVNISSGGSYQSSLFPEQPPCRQPQLFVITSTIMIFSSSSLCFPAYSQQVKPQGVCACVCVCVSERDREERERGRIRSKASVHEEQHVTETPCIHEKNQVTPRSDQNNNRRACTCACSPTHKHTAVALFSHKHTRSCTAVKSQPLAGFAAFVCSENNFFHPDHVPKHLKTSFQKLFNDIKFPHISTVIWKVWESFVGFYSPLLVKK